MNSIEKEEVVKRLNEVKLELAKLDDVMMPAYVARKLIGIDNELKLMLKFYEISH